MSKETFSIATILHASFICHDLEKSVCFYRDVLDMTVDNSRPDLGYPGAWLEFGKYQVHLLQLPNPDPVTGRPQHGGRDRHVAFSVDNLDALAARLAAHGLSFTRSKSGRKALFVRDPDGNALEFIEMKAPEV
jgi:glyoxylase I family protein